MNILAVGSHFNNIEMGCGGALFRHIQDGDDVTMFVAASRGMLNSERQHAGSSEELSDDIRETTALFGTRPILGGFETLSLEFDDALNSKVTHLVTSKNIDLIYTHYPDDPQHDHRALARACIHAGRRVPRILAYQCNSYQSEHPFAPNFYVDVTPFWEKKEEAMAVYISNAGAATEDKLRFIRNTARMNGARNGVRYAEGFKVIKWLEL